MFQRAQTIFIKTITPSHPGSGSDLGIVDLPIQRESHTGYPKIESSSLKGSLRDAFEQKGVEPLKIHTVFGYDESNDKGKKYKKIFDDKSQFAGALGFSDARILFFPVKSVRGVFAWVTSPSVIQRFIEDMSICGESIDFLVPQSNTVPQGSKTKLQNDNIVILEEYSIDVCEDENTSKIARYFKQKLDIDPSKIVILDDDTFSDFVKMFTEIITRTKIDNETGTVEEGALFNEEYLPSETILYSLALFAPVFAPKVQDLNLRSVEDVQKFFVANAPEVFQIGGNATIGKGICKLFKGRDDA